MACHYIPLYNIITYYVTIMTLIAIMANNTLLCPFMTISRRQSRHFLSKKMLEWATHLGYHVDGESQQLDHLVQWMTWTCGPGICTLCSKRRAVSAMNVHGMPWIKLVPTVGEFEAQWYGQPFRTVGLPSSCTSSCTTTHAVTRL